MEDIVVFKSLKMFNSDNSYMCLYSRIPKVILYREATNEDNQF